MNRVVAILIAVAFHTGMHGAVAGESQPAAQLFQESIRPLFATRCLKCHGPQKAEGGLNLTDQASATAMLDSGSTAVVPGNIDASELLRRVTSGDPDERMPSGGEPLSDRDVATLRNWIAGGAPWPPHWAYSRLVRPAIPKTAPSAPSWCRTPVDRFVLAKLQVAGLGPSPPAERRALVRRLYFDMLGLPPTPDQLEAFLSDTAPDALDRVVDRLVSDPAYGERWARHWMDVVHFAETHGHDQDRPRDNAWPYRDYLIRALNDDRPYQVFLQQQIAGDVLFPDDPWATAATGFLAAGPWDESSLRDIRDDSLDREIGRYLDRDDIITTVMSTFASTSVHCARCHDHKFDPISQETYYAFQSIFAGTDKANRAYDADPRIGAERNWLMRSKQQTATQLADGNPALLDPAVQSDVEAWEQSVQKAALIWQPLEILDVLSSGGATLTRLDDGSTLAGGPRPEKDVYTITGRTNLSHVTAIRIDVLTHESLPHQGPGRQDNGNLHLNEVNVSLATGTAPESWKSVELINPRADFNQQGWTIAMAIDDNQQTAWGIYPEVGKGHRAVFEFKEPPASTGGVHLKLELHQVHGGGHLIGRFRILVSQEPAPLPLDSQSLPSDITKILTVAGAERTPELRMKLAAYVIGLNLDRQIAALPKPQLVYCGTSHFDADGSFRPSATPREVKVLRRGLVTDPLSVAHPAALACIDGVPAALEAADLRSDESRRAALAQWLSRPDNGLTWRSIANRTWQYHFGRGIIDTPNDFGQMGEPPTHPELLDWLAKVLQEKGGSLKELHRILLLSAVYQQASDHRADAANVDADNRWLWRMNRRRLDAESYRDALLVVTGSLDRKMGGPSVKQFIQTPGVHVTPNVDYQGFDPGNPANFRRSVYRFIFRTIPDPFMDALDCPDASQLTPKRNVSVTALQALATLNDKFVIQQSERLAALIEREASEPKRIELLYRSFFGRAPTDTEIHAVRQYVQKHGMANACRFLANTNEFLFVD